MTFTEAQRRAINTHDRNMIVVAGAGSGKTRVLVERYLALLDANPDWPLNAIIAITFTEKAAEEMRDRVRQGLVMRQAQAKTAAEATRWATLVGQIHSARISTIHSLCATLLRGNAAQAGLDPGFDVLDEDDSALLLEDVVEDVLLEVAQEADSPLTSLLADYDLRTIRGVLLNPSLIYSVHDVPDAETLLCDWQAHQEAWRQNLVVDFVEGLRDFPFPSPMPDTKTKMGQVWQDVIQIVERLEAGQAAFEDLQILAGISPPGGKDTTETREQLKAILSWAKSTVETAGGPLSEVDEHAAEQIVAWSQLIVRVRDAFESAKRRRNVLNFDDLERLAADLLATHEEVRKRYQGREFQHVLVDEFQDTNARQWRIIRALTGLENPGRLFVVGDPKQSIYAFRGADVSVFGDVQDSIESSAGVSGALAKSFRTHAPLVEDFNALFGALMQKDAPPPVRDYQVELGEPMVAHRTKPPSGRPAFSMLVINEHEFDATGKVIPQGNGKDKLDADERRQWEAHELANRIKNMVEQEGRQVHDKATGEVRPMRYDDVAILMRAVSKVTLYEEVFKQVGLPFVTVSGRGYYNRQEVWDLQNLLSALYNPSDDLALATVLRSPMFGLSDDTLLALRLQRDAEGESLPLWQALQDPGELLPDEERDRVAFAWDCLRSLHVQAGRITIAELLRSALSQTGYMAILTGLPDGARRRGNVEKLLEKADASREITLQSFTRYLREMSQREVREGEAPVDVSGAVTVMTVHASKGLEYPVIVLADASHMPRGGGSAVLHDDRVGLACKVYEHETDKMVKPFCYQYAEQVQAGREEAEHRRLLYVALTRARDAVIVSGQAGIKKDGDWASKGWMARLLETLDVLVPDAGQDETVGTLAGELIPVDFPRCRPESAQESARSLDVNRWPDAARSDAETAEAPRLLSPVWVDLTRRARHLAATHIADLGGVEAAENEDASAYYGLRLRRSVLADAPAHVESVNVEPAQRVSQRQVGEMVHEALRYWRLPVNQPVDELERLLSVYAWRHGVTGQHERAEAIQRASYLLGQFCKSPVYHAIGNAEQVYRELPFIYERDGFVIHGIIDLLYRDQSGRWIIVDYKTASLGKLSPEDHARRYHLQLGVYADAVARQLGGEIPETYVHYLRGMITVPITYNDRETALDQSMMERVQEVLKERNG